MSAARRLLFVAVAVGGASALFGRRAEAVERNLAGSAQFDYHFVPNNSSTLPDRQVPLQGFTTEAAVKIAADITDKLSANVKVCFGCHGFELPMAYFDYRVAEELNFRIGRFSPSFGNFNLRHDPANHKFNDKPLPYDMGRMLRMREWNMGVLPSPFPDNGFEINGTHWFGEKAQLDYAIYAINGFRGDKSAQDIDFQQSRSRDSYYVDNNGRPTVGGRLALTIKLGQTSDMTIGGSGMTGTYDPDNKLHYTIVGADISMRLNRTNIRAEWLARKTEFDISDPSIFRYKFVEPKSNNDFFVKHGAYLEIEQPITKNVDLLARADGLYRKGNVVAESPLRRQSAVTRLTLGTAIVLERGYRLKVTGEYWDFSDAGKDGRHGDFGAHIGVVGTF
ncbi:MAG: hypothetical protein ACXWP4_12060 [Polyangiales bacterium]